MRLSSWLLLVVVVAALSLVGPAARLVSDGWWFASIGYGSVFQTVLSIQIGLGLLGGGVAAVVVGGSARFAGRWNRPRPPGGHGDRAPPRGSPRSAVPRLASGGREAPPWSRISPLAAADGVTVLVALVSAATAAGAWQEVLLALEGGAFGWQDPVWGLDARFYVFELALLLSALRWLGALLVVAFVVSGATYVALGTVRVQLVQQDGQLVTTGILLPAEVQRHIGGLVAALLLVAAALSYLHRYSAMHQPSGLFVGPGYADLHATLPLLGAEAAGTAICALLGAVAIGRGSLVGAGAAAGAILLLKLGTAIVPGLVQRLSVDPNELSREGPQILDHLRATRFALRLEEVEERPLSGRVGIEQADLEQSRGTLDNVRLWDDRPLLEALGQIQQIRAGYGFVGVDDERYLIDGQLRQVISSPRELNHEGLPIQARTWVNETLIYTHGYGLVLGPAGEVGFQGLPELFVRDLPPRIEHPEVFGVERPEIYFGEAALREAIVGTDHPEFDHPDGEQNVYSRYAGRDGVTLGWLGRLVFAIRLGASEVLLSSDLRPGSRVLMYRNVTERARRIAPFFRYDSDPYLVIDQGRLVWVLDGYTVSDRFPYASFVEGLGNYVRNPVKVTVDAYDGAIVFWRTPEVDPIADAWAAAFPELFRPLEAMPGSLAAHLRYPSDLLTAQASLLGTHHTEQASAFYDRDDQWEIPSSGGAPAGPYRAIVRLPGEEREEFVSMLPLSPKGKQSLAAWMVARSDGPHHGQLRVYRLPRDAAVPGPQAVAARIEQDDAIGEKRALWGQQGSEVGLGALRLIPIEESPLYVQPLYLQTRGSIPELKRVIVAYRDRIAMGQTLEEGLDRLFGPAETSSGGMALPEVTTAELIRRAGLHWDAARLAMQRGDWAEYGAQMRALGEMLDSLRGGIAETR